MSATRLPLGLIRRTADRLCRTRTLARWLFGIEFPPIDPGDRYFDLTTPALVRVVAPALHRRSRVLDMGTGPFAVVGLALWRRTGCSVVSTEIDSNLVTRARRNVAANKAPIEVRQTRFFEGLEDGDFDCVVFNPPYVPQGMLAGPDPRSDGGPDGTSVVEAFLDAFACGPAAEAFLGVNAIFVGRERIAPLLDRRPRLRLKEVRRPLALPIDVYRIERTRPGRDGIGA